MTANSPMNGVYDAVIQPFVAFWSEYANQVNDSTREFLDGIDDHVNFKTMQRRWFDAVSKSMDAYMRSPMFLQAMKHQSDAAVKVKLQADDWANEIARNVNIPTTGDISGLFERLHSVEDTILSQLGSIQDRLGTIEEKIGSRELANT